MRPLYFMAGALARRKRETESYLESIQILAPFIPSFKKYKKRKRLKPAEKSYIARIENILKQNYTQINDLKPVSRSELKYSKDILYEPETIIKTGRRKGQKIRHHFLRAQLMRNVGDDFKMKHFIKDMWIATDHGRTWIYWKLPDVRSPSMREAAKTAFSMQERAEEFNEAEEDDIPVVQPEGYDIDAVIELAREAFEIPSAKGVYLWADKGRVGDVQTSFRQFVYWITHRYEKYQRVEEWVKGLAILIADVDEFITDEMWAVFSPTREQKIAARKATGTFYRRRRR